MAQACVAGDFAPPEKKLELTGRTRMLVTWDGAVERFVVDLAYRGDAEDFGFVIAFPARPSVAEAAEDLFAELATYTRPREREKMPGTFDVGLSFGGIRATASADAGVEVLEEKTIGDFDATVLNATDDRALVAWLTERGFTVPSRDADNIRAVVARGGATFVAVHVNAARAWRSRNTVGAYDTPPLAFAFRPSQPVIPLRLAADDDPVQHFSIYTIGTTPQIIPGAGLVFSDRLPRKMPKEYAALTPYALPHAWLVRMEVMVDPSRITEDLAVVPWNAPTAERVRFGDALALLVPERTQADGGVLAPTDARVLQRFAVDEWDDADLGETRAERAAERRRELTDAALAVGVPLVLFLLAHIITALALRSLARSRDVRRRWFVWVPFLNCDLVRRLAQVPRRWGMSSIMVFAIPVLAVLGASLLDDLLWTLLRTEMFDFKFRILWFVLGIMVFVLFIMPVVWWFRLWFALARSYNHSRWWGAAMAIPLLGAVPLAVMAWRVRHAAREGVVAAHL